ncbi:ribosomal L7Ae/L30e/S12e/Gadd45 family protein [Candidatus Woesearchaeota archaeon]|nr:ribosomal L7Ae/L30e/S12e/Gadd45 family protein [Candidatus Woesearchaeota archaeon]
MAEKSKDKDINEIRKLLKGKKIIVGADRTMKSLKQGKVKKVYLSSNCSEKIEGCVDYYSKLGKVQVIRLKYPSDELGILCKKSFSISILSVPL